MALVKCIECGKKISSNAAVCIHCGNPLDNYEMIDYKSFYDLNEKERVSLKNEFEQKTKVKLKRFSNLGLVVLCIIKACFWLLGLVTSLSYIPLIKNFGFYFLLVCVIDFVLSYVWISKGIKDNDEEFSMWLSVSKHIKK